MERIQFWETIDGHSFNVYTVGSTLLPVRKSNVEDAGVERVSSAQSEVPGQVSGEEDKDRNVAASQNTEHNRAIV
mgnify:CR=1 FL=1